MSMALVLRSQIVKSMRTLSYYNKDELVFKQVDPTAGEYSVEDIQNYSVHAPWLGISIRRMEAYRENFVPFARLYISATAVCDDNSRQKLYRDDTIITIQEQLLVSLTDIKFCRWNLDDIDDEITIKPIEDVVSNVIYSSSVDGLELAICEVQFVQDISVLPIRYRDLLDLESVRHELKTDLDPVNPNKTLLEGQVGLTEG